MKVVWKIISHTEMIKSKLNACWIAQAFSLPSHPVPSYFNEKHDVVLHLHIRSQVWNHSNNYHIRNLPVEWKTI